MLGPSGSGKTTCLRLIAGFEQPDARRRSCCTAGRCRASRPTTAPVNTVFQDYALFPHMSVLDNVAYGLMVRGVGQGRAPAQGARRCSSWWRCGGRARGARRSSPAASGSAWRWRAPWSIEPEVLLLDEPLGALDLKLRQQMQGELKALQRKVGITFVFVTHDQDEALGMADRVAVFNQGRIEQIGTRRGGLRASGDGVRRGLRRQLQHRRRRDGAAPVRPRRRLRAAAGADRPRRPGEVAVEGTVVATQYHGASTRLESSSTAGRVLVVDRTNDGSGRRPAVGERVRLGWPASAMQPLRGTAVMPRSPPRRTPLRRLSTWLWRHGHWLTLILLLPPLLWLGVVYLGSLLALLAQSFFRLDEFSGQIVYEWGLSTYVELLTQRANLDIILRTVLMAAAVTLASALIAFPIAYMAARYAGPQAQGAVLPRRHAAAVVELSRRASTPGS